MRKLKDSEFLPKKLQSTRVWFGAFLKGYEEEFAGTVTIHDLDPYEIPAAEITVDLLERWAAYLEDNIKTLSTAKTYFSASLSHLQSIVSAAKVHQEVSQHPGDSVAAPRGRQSPASSTGAAWWVME